MKIQSNFITIALTLFSIFYQTSLNGQQNFEIVDSIAMHFEESGEGIDYLAKQLTKDLETDIEKARVLYMWIAKNINFEQLERNGKQVFFIPKSSSKKIVLYGGRSLRSRMERLAFFRI